MGENKQQDSVNLADLGAALPSITSGISLSLSLSLPLSFLSLYLLIDQLY